MGTKRSYSKSHEEEIENRKYNGESIIQLQNEIRRLKRRNEELEETVFFLRNFV